jgi:hypothetical protein
VELEDALDKARSAGLQGDAIAVLERLRDRMRKALD